MYSFVTQYCLEVLLFHNFKVIRSTPFLICIKEKQPEISEEVNEMNMEIGGKWSHDFQDTDFG